MQILECNVSNNDCSMCLDTLSGNINVNFSSASLNRVAGFRIGLKFERYLANREMSILNPYVLTYDTRAQFLQEKVDHNASRGFSIS